MTRLLEKAFAEASKLSKDEQEALARWLLEELASERRWEQAFKASPGRLWQLAHEALQEEEAGETEELDPDRL